MDIAEAQPAAKKQKTTSGPVSLPPIKSMRDINDFCVSQGIPSLAQGMIELPPPMKLREMAAKCVLEENVHTYRTRAGEAEYLKALSHMMREVFGETVAPEQILAVQGVTGGIVSSLMVLRARNPAAKVAVIEPFYTYHQMQVKNVFQTDPVFVGQRRMACPWTSTRSRSWHVRMRFRPPLS